MSSLPKATSKAVYQRDCWHCRHCNRNDQLHPHHIVYRSAGGSDDLSNLVTLCAKCHDDVHGGRLKLELFEARATHIKFWKQEGWKP
jgi:5-methylcytosine-specific restriction endonuclease McrA